jgi:hypothetical protein
MKRRGSKDITLRNVLGMNFLNKSNENHQDLREIWVGERGGVPGRRRRRKKS